MAIKKKVKISNVKRSQHLKNKKNYTKPLTKTEPKKPSTSENKNLTRSKKIFGKVTHQKPKRKEKKKFTPQNEQEPHYNGQLEEEEANNVYNDIIDMVDDDAKAFFNSNQIKARKRKREDGDNDENKSAKHFEKQYAEIVHAEDSKKKKLINLLPIKNKLGEVINRTTEVEYEDAVSEAEIEEEQSEEEEEEVIDSDDDIIENKTFSTDIRDSSMKAISTADLLILRDQEIARQKYRIGIICSGIIEKPEDKIKHFTSLFELMDIRSGEQANLVTVRKIAALSLLEVFKDILPEYRIGQLNYKMQTVRKNTMERMTFENSLLQQYKKYLQKLEKMSSLLSKRGNSNKCYALEYIKLGEVAVACLCELLTAHPYFNFGQNISQLLVYLLNCNYPSTRTTILKCFQEIFKTDKKFDITLFIVRRLNHLIKSNSNNVHVEVLTILLSLQIKSINLDVEKDNELKQKKLEAHKSRLMNMSKREKKRRKRLSQLDKEMQETKAEENKQTKHYKLTEITKMMFTIYFRILKNDPNSQLLSATLEGLAEFAHVINLDFFSDLVEVLNNIMENHDLGYREQLHCIQTLFTILSGQGEALNIDPIRFYTHLYRNLLVVNAGKNHKDILIILRSLDAVLIKRRKNMTHNRLLAFIKRIVTLSLQLLHNGTLGCLGIVKTVMQLTSTLDIILDTDSSIGSGRYNAELEDPEYCNANCTALYEIGALARHYHPTIKKISTHIAAGLPASGEGCLNPEVGKLSYLELYKQYDGSEMAFNPTIPAPKKIVFREIKGRHFYVDNALEEHCNTTLNCRIQSVGVMNFCSEYRKGLTEK